MKIISSIGGGFDPNWSTMPLIKPKNFQWSATQSEVNIYIDRCITKHVDPTCVNFGWLLESPVVLQEIGIYEYIEKNIHELKQKFIKIFTCDKNLLNDNFFVYCYSDIMPWILEENYAIYPKNKMCSIVASAQKKHPGHLLRHEIIEKVDNIDHYGFGYQTALSIENTLFAFKDYMFSFCVENCSCPGYWGVKLTNAIACGTVPIYWGDRTIHEVFNINGFILLNDTFDPKVINENTYYEKRRYVQENFEILKHLQLPEDYLFTKYLDLYI